MRQPTDYVLPGEFLIAKLCEFKLDVNTKLQREWCARIRVPVGILRKAVRGVKIDRLSWVKLDHSVRNPGKKLPDKLAL